MILKPSALVKMAPKSAAHHNHSKSILTFPISVTCQGSSGSKTPPPSIFQPPQPRLRNTIRGQHDQGASAHHSMDSTMRANGSFKTSDSSSERCHSQLEGKTQVRNQHAAFKKTFSSYTSDLQLFSKETSFHVTRERREF